MNDFHLEPEPTPNPNAMKFTLPSTVREGPPLNWNGKADAGDSPFASLFDISGVTNVFVLGNFITISKSAEVEWSDLIEPAKTKIKEGYNSL